jgi:hypothetical protein
LTILSRRARFLIEPGLRRTLGNVLRGAASERVQPAARRLRRGARDLPRSGAALRRGRDRAQGRGLERGRSNGQIGDLFVVVAKTDPDAKLVQSIYAGWNEIMKVIIARRMGLDSRR